MRTQAMKADAVITTAALHRKLAFLNRLKKPI